MTHSPALPTARLLARTFVVASLAAAAVAAVAAPSTQLIVNGAVDHPAAYDLAGLQALPPITQTVAFQSGSTPQTHTYVGADLWNTLSLAGVQTNSAIKNDINNKYVVATGSDGYKTAFAMGELNPSFGNKGSLIAYEETINGVTAPLGSDGFARTTAPGDVKGGRYVSNLVSLSVGGVAPAPVGPGGDSTSFSVSGDVLHPMTFDLSALEALAPTTVSVGGNSYTGTSFWSLLSATVGLATDPLVKNDELDMLVLATGSDGYQQLFSLGELDPAFGNAPDLIAYSENGAALPGTGFARIVAPNDIKAGRWVSNLVSLEVFHGALPVPEPATWGLMLAGLAAGDDGQPAPRADGVTDDASGRAECAQALNRLPIRGFAAAGEVPRAAFAQGMEAPASGRPATVRPAGQCGDSAASYRGETSSGCWLQSNPSIAIRTPWSRMATGRRNQHLEQFHD